MGALTPFEAALGWTFVLLPIVLVILIERSAPYRRPGRVRACVDRARERIARERERTVDARQIGRW